jgi:UDP-N-acetylglucosamine 2-epimerase (non-hydrolysing)
VELLPLAPHHEFMRMLAAAPLAIIDGGSIQEECALLGVPTLLWRKRTERPNGLGENVVLSRFDPVIIDAFLGRPDQWRRPPVDPPVSPSEQILDALLDEQGAGG